MFVKTRPDSIAKKLLDLMLSQSTRPNSDKLGFVGVRLGTRKSFPGWHIYWHNMTYILHNLNTLMAYPKSTYTESKQQLPSYNWFLQWGYLQITSRFAHLSNRACTELNNNEYLRVFLLCVRVFSYYVLHYSYLLILY